MISDHNCNTRFELLSISLPLLNLLSPYSLLSFPPPLLFSGSPRELLPFSVSHSHGRFFLFPAFFSFLSFFSFLFFALSFRPAAFVLGLLSDPSLFSVFLLVSPSTCRRCHTAAQLLLAARLPSPVEQTSNHSQLFCPSFKPTV